VDEHCYANPIWFLSNSDRYDAYDRNGPKIFFGEYAAQSVAICSTKNRNNLECALAEAAYMTGLERNADVVRMASYAPLFAHVDGWQWTPDLIWTDNLRVCGTPNYYVQQLFSLNRGDVVLPVSNDAPVQEILPAGGIGLGTLQAAAEFKDVHVTRGKKTLFASDLSAGVAGWTDPASAWQVKDGAYQQPDPQATASTFAGETSWTDYTLTLKARKLAGSEGIVITVLNDGAGAYVTWSLGGWGNQYFTLQSHYAEQDQFLGRVPGSLETGRWYDIKIAIKGPHVDCTLDGRLIQSADVLVRRVPALFASATRDDHTGEVILKVVNAQARPAPVSIQIAGTSMLKATGTAITLSGDPKDENSLDSPTRISPASSKVSGVGSKFTYTFRPHSLTVLRLGQRS
jgi:alpha-L-arabinofuranosidase